MARASAIKLAMANLIESIVPNDQTTASDTFRYLDAGSIDYEAMPDRVFVIKLASQPQRIEINNCDTYQVGYDIQFFYAASQSGIEDRIADDTEMVSSKVERLFETVGGVMRVDIDPAGLVEISDSTIVSVFSVLIKYQLDSTVVNN